jgi:hypothetical protein
VTADRIICCYGPGPWLWTTLRRLLENQCFPFQRALWPAFLAAKTAGKKAQFQRARLMIDGERVFAPAG